MATKLFVRNLSFKTTDESLQAAFSSCGTVVSAVVIKDRASGRSKGFAFVEMSTEDEAKSAMDQLNGKEVDGREIFVTEARPQEERAPRGGGRFER